VASLDKEHGLDRMIEQIPTGQQGAPVPSIYLAECPSGQWEPPCALSNGSLMKLCSNRLCLFNSHHDPSVAQHMTCTLMFHSQDTSGHLAMPDMDPKPAGRLKGENKYRGLSGLNVNSTHQLRLSLTDNKTSTFIRPKTQVNSLQPPCVPL
jgi:hypothetical protein